MSKTVFLVDKDTDLIVNTIWVDDNWSVETNIFTFPPNTYPLEPDRNTSMGISHKYDKVNKQIINVFTSETETAVYEHTIKESIQTNEKTITTRKTKDKTLIGETL